MKATGIVRRIDDLGRVVIPKEIRRTLRIREGDPLEIYTDRDGEVIFKKYSPLEDLGQFAAQYAETLYKTCDLSVVICDRDSVLAAAGIPKRDYLEHRISEEAERILERRGVYLYAPGEVPLELINGQNSHPVSCLMPILVEGDVIGGVATLFSPDEKQTHRPSETETKLIQTAAGFLGRQMES